MNALRRAAPATLVVALLGFACDSGEAECTCPAERGGERRLLACGETTCVGGREVSCVSGGVVERGGCAPRDGLGGAPLDGGASSGAAPVDRSCEDLRNFCATACSRPASASAECFAVAATGDARQCATWPTTYGALCRS